jgi:hypothetical protein
LKVPMSSDGPELHVHPVIQITNFMPHTLHPVNLDIPLLPTCTLRK